LNSVTNLWVIQSPAVFYSNKSSVCNSRPAIIQAFQSSSCVLELSQFYCICCSCAAGGVCGLSVPAVLQHDSCHPDDQCHHRQPRHPVGRLLHTAVWTLPVWIQGTVNSRYLKVFGTIFYMFKLPAVQINLHFG